LIWGPGAVSSGSYEFVAYLTQMFQLKISELLYYAKNCNFKRMKIFTT